LRRADAKRSSRISAAGIPNESEGAMPKMKTKKCLIGRFKVTGTGKVIRKMCGKSHRMVSFTGKRVRQLRRTKNVANALAKRIKRGLLAG
jgi:large subunit ribosomal protein L35